MATAAFCHSIWNGGIANKLVSHRIPERKAIIRFSKYVLSSNDPTTDELGAQQIDGA
jgi:hypothetical protein